MNGRYKLQRLEKSVYEITKLIITMPETAVLESAVLERQILYRIVEHYK